MTTSIRSVDPKLTRVMTKSCNTSNIWSRNTRKTLYIHIHKAHGPKTWQGVESRWRTPHKSSRDTVILQSRENSRPSYIPNLEPPNLAVWVVTCKAKWHFYLVVTLQRRHTSLSQKLWPVALAKDERTSLKLLQLTWHFHHSTNWKRYAYFF